MEVLLNSQILPHIMNAINLVIFVYKSLVAKSSQGIGKVSNDITMASHQRSFYPQQYCNTQYTGVIIMIWTHLF